MAYRVVISESLEEKMKKLDILIKRRIFKLVDKLEQNPFVGKPLKYDFFREKKMNGFRLYYLILKDVLLVVFLDFSDKKGQQKVIDTILMNLKQTILEIKRKYG